MVAGELHGGNPITSSPVSKLFSSVISRHEGWTHDSPEEASRKLAHGVSSVDTDFIKEFLDPVETIFTEFAGDDQHLQATFELKENRRFSIFDSCLTSGAEINSMHSVVSPGSTSVPCSIHVNRMIPVPMQDKFDSLNCVNNLEDKPSWTHSIVCEDIARDWNRHKAVYGAIARRDTPTMSDRPKRRIDSWEIPDRNQDTVSSKKPRMNLTMASSRSGPPCNDSSLMPSSQGQCTDEQTPSTSKRSKNKPAFRGVSLHRLTKRWEASLWLSGRQLYLGGFEKQEEAARAYDLAALACKGLHANTNFPPFEYEEQLKELEGFTKEEVVAHVRRRSAAFARGRSKYRGVSGHVGRWEARIGTFKGRKNMSFGIFDTENAAAKQYDRALIIEKGRSAKTNFPLKEYEQEAAEYAQWLQAYHNSGSPGAKILPGMQPYVLPKDREPTIEEMRRGAVIFGHDLWGALCG